MSNTFAHRFGRQPIRRRILGSAGFTLVELLIVIGIIALLATLLLTAISKAREAGRRTTCLSNLGNIAKAIMAYASDNEGILPGAAADLVPAPPPPAVATDSGARPFDWIWWQSFRIDQIGQGGVGFYLKINAGGNLHPTPSDLAVLRCPSDDLARPKVAFFGGDYLFSYVLNAMMSSGNNKPGALPLGVFPARNIRQVVDASQKILVYEEDPRFMSDGNGALLPNIPGTQLLSIRHDSITAKNDNPTMAASYPGVPRVPNPGAMGNVAFCDGHAAAISRADAHSRLHFAPDSGSPPWPANNVIP